MAVIREEGVDECDGVKVPAREGENFGVFDAKESELGSNEV